MGKNIKIYRSPFPNVEIPSTDLLTYTLSNPNNIPDSKQIYVDSNTGASRTYGEIKQRTHALAHGLRNLGVKPQEVVALFSPNTIDYAILCYGVLGCGATVSPVTAAATPTELNSQLKTSRTRYLIAHSTLLETAKKAINLGGTSVTRVIQADGLTDTSDPSQPTAERLATVHSSTTSPLTTIPPGTSQERLSVLCFSSGTTGPAKGVMTTHRNLIANVEQWLSYLPSTAQSSNHTHIAFLPFSHIYALMYFVFLSVRQGTTMVLMSTSTGFNLDMYLSLVAKWRPEQLMLVPPIMVLLGKDPRFAKYDLSSLKTLFSAAAPLSSELRMAVEDRFQKEKNGQIVRAFQAWGMTETSPLVTTVPADRLGDKRHTVGCLSPNCELRLVDPDTLKDIEEEDPTDRGWTRPGEIWVRGPNIFAGYYRNAEATKSTFAADEEGGERWFRTGDIGKLDSESYLVIVDRIKEMIKYKGLQVIPSELEGKLLECPVVDDACVVAGWDEAQATEVPAGFIVVKNKNTKEEAVVKKEVEKWLNARIAAYKRLRGGIYIVEAIPKSPSGKILRRQLKESLKKMDAGKGRSKL